MTRRLSSGRVGAGVDQAISAVVEWRAPGLDVYTVDKTPLPTTRASYHIVTTPVLAAGTYFITVAMLVTGQSQGTDIAIDIEIDGVALGVVLSEAGVVGGGFVLSAQFPAMFTDGTHTIDYLAWQPAGPGVATASDAFTTWVREA